MTEPEHDEETELVEPTVAPVPEPDQDTDDDEAESERAETHEPADEPVEAPEAQGTTPEEWEARFTKTEQRFKTYTAAVTKIWEEDALHLMPFPLDAGAPTGFIDVRNKGRVDDETKAAVLAFLGFEGAGSLKPDPYSDPCETCGGEGLVDTKSKVPNQGARQCLDCKGLGFIPTGAPIAGTNGQNVALELVEPGQRVPAAVGVESPEVESLRLRGYTIIPPMNTGV